MPSAGDLLCVLLDAARKSISNSALLVKCGLLRSGLGPTALSWLVGPSSALVTHDPCLADCLATWKHMFSMLVGTDAGPVAGLIAYPPSNLRIADGSFPRVQYHRRSGGGWVAKLAPIKEGDGDGEAGGHTSVHTDRPGKFVDRCNTRTSDGLEEVVAQYPESGMVVLDHPLGATPAMVGLCNGDSLVMSRMAAGCVDEGGAAKPGGGGTRFVSGFTMHHVPPARMPRVTCQVRVRVRVGVWG